MHVVSVIPITRGITKEELSYYTAEKVVLGDIVTVPLRRKKVPALVTNVSDIRTQKISLRKAPFKVKKVEKIHSHNFFLPAFMRAVQKTAIYFASSTGALLNTVVPKNIITDSLSPKNKTKETNTRYDMFALQDEKAVRLAHYKSLARELFTKKQSLLIILPTRTDAEIFFEQLKRGITKNTILLHTGLSKRKLHDAWHNGLSTEHPALVVATPRFLSLPRNDIGTIVIEQESSRHYKATGKPYTDYRVFAEYLAQENNVPLILGDTLLQIETLRRLREGDIRSVTQPRMRYFTNATTEVVDMQNYTKKKSKDFQVISNELLRMLSGMEAATDRCFVYTLRKGLFPLTVCGDCGRVVICTHCSAPVVVHKDSREQHVFICHRCKKQRTAEEKCRNCTSWNLAPLGVGSQRVEKELSTKLSNLPLLYADSDTMTPAQIKKVVEKWYITSRSVLVGTEVVLPYLQETSHIAVASMDTLFALPDFRARERLLRMLLYLREQATKKLLIQTRNSEDIVFEQIRDGSILPWYREELEERKAFSYPPFTTLIKITTTGSGTTLTKLVAKLENDLKKYMPQTFPAFIPRVRGKDVMHTLISLPYGTWPEHNLVEYFRNIPPLYAVNVDPEHLL